jgi:phosphoribosylformylglycinamidine synthase
MSKVTVNVLYLPGTNCHRETLEVFRRLGATPRLSFITDIVAGRDRLDSSDILCLPGGFSFGDHVAAGVLGAIYLKSKLQEQLAACRSRPILGICNGFQTAVRAGLFGPHVTMTFNTCGTFRDVRDQVHIVDPQNHSGWLAGLAGEPLAFPCAHGEGRFVYRKRAGWLPALSYPPDANPDGSMDDIAGVTSEDGLVFGLINHPERAQRSDRNLEIFRNGLMMV